MKSDSGKTLLGTLMLNQDYGEKHIDVTSLLLSYPSLDLSKPLDNSGITPIHVFAMRGMIDALKKWLPSSPSLVNIRDDDGHTPLHYTVMQLCHHTSVKFCI